MLTAYNYCILIATSVSCHNTITVAVCSRCLPDCFLPSSSNILVTGCQAGGVHQGHPQRNQHKYATCCRQKGKHELLHAVKSLTNISILLSCILELPLIRQILGIVVLLAWTCLFSVYVPTSINHPAPAIFCACTTQPHLLPSSQSSRLHSFY